MHSAAHVGACVGGVRADCAMASIAERRAEAGCDRCSARTDGLDHPRSMRCCPHGGSPISAVDCHGQWPVAWAQPKASYFLHGRHHWLVRFNEAPRAASKRRTSTPNRAWANLNYVCYLNGTAVEGCALDPVAGALPGMHAVVLSNLSHSLQHHVGELALIPLVTKLFTFLTNHLAQCSKRAKT